MGRERGGEVADVEKKLDEEEGREGCCATGGSTELMAGAIGW